MADNTQDQNLDNNYFEQDTDTDTAGNKGGTSQQPYRDTTDTGSQRESDYDTDDEMNESTSGW